MMSEPWFYQLQRDAAAKVIAEMAKPMPVADCLGDADAFDPWELFPFYGTYDSEFDECAIAVLKELQTGTKERRDLASDMFREILCNLDLCEYGSSPRVCFPTKWFGDCLSELIEKWGQFSKLHWGE